MLQKCSIFGNKVWDASARQFQYGTKNDICKREQKKKLLLSDAPRFFFRKYDLIYEVISKLLEFHFKSKR